jgi:enoyl-CoA hydratase/carnithine racemase
MRRSVDASIGHKRAVGVGKSSPRSGHDAYAGFGVDRGIAPEAASSLLLPLRIGYGRTMELFLTDRRVEAEEAVTLGLVTRVLKEQSPDQVALEVARLIAAKPSLAARAKKHLVRARLAESMAALGRDRLDSRHLRRAACG